MHWLRLTNTSIVSLHNHLIFKSSTKTAETSSRSKTNSFSFFSLNHNTIIIGSVQFLKGSVQFSVSLFEHAIWSAPWIKAFKFEITELWQNLLRGIDMKTVRRKRICSHPYIRFWITQGSNWHFFIHFFKLKRKKMPLNLLIRSFCQT